MTLLQISVFVVIAALAGLARRWRVWILMAASVLAIFWMQPPTPIRNLDFWLPAATIGLTALVWAGTRDSGEKRENWAGVGVLTGLVLLVGLSRYLGPLCCLTPTRPPAILQILAAAAIVFLLGLAIARSFAARPRLGEIFVVLIFGLFIVLKTAPWAQTASAGLRSITGQPTELATAFDIRWLGFSYIAFRLIHTLRDRIAGRLPDLRLHEFVAYVIFFPSFTAGPIDRVQRFLKDLRQPDLANGKSPTRISRLSEWREFIKNIRLIRPAAPFAFQNDFADGVQRIVLGVFKKFVLADGLTLMALNSDSAGRVTSTGWLWVLLYAYSLRLFFDFSGYTDIAIGIGRLAGIRLPENFERPYLKPNLTQFWNSWHITLAQWFRAYFFNPLTRALRGSPKNIPMPLVIFVGQLGTMLLIGLWHGVTWNFVAWGLWHGLGLFAHNRWSEATKGRFAGLAERPWLQKAVSVGGVLLTFHYVTLGWVWFALPTMDSSWQVFAKLFGG